MTAASITATAEFNFDGLVGPTHNYAGLAQGNLASQQNRHLTSHPKQAALQGLAKMKFLMDLGVPQAVLPPQLRPDISVLRRLGFTGSDADILARAARDAAQLLAACSSASFMWAANAATVSPSADTADGRLHLTPANLTSHLHRSLECPATAAVLRAIFPGPLFIHHDPLHPSLETADEGAANHLRLWAHPDQPALEIFAYGFDASPPPPAGRFAPRQSRAASLSIARLHQLDPARTFFVRQNSIAIQAGAFHTDVVAVAHRNILLYHEHAFLDGESLITTVRRAFDAAHPATPLYTIRIPDDLLPLADAIRSYLFNSQLVTLSDDRLALIAPRECRSIPAAGAALDFIRDQLPDLQIHFVDVRQSMLNGGGPACLRLRITLTPQQQAAMHPGVRLTAQLYERLHAWIHRHYRDDLHPADLSDPHLLAETRSAQHDLANILDLPHTRSDP